MDQETTGGRQFHLQERIGSGAFGEVYLAEQESGAGFRRKVALKMLNESVAGSEEAAMRMRDEARILGRLAHRNIVAVLDLVRLNDKWTVVMDYVPGVDLAEVVEALHQREDTCPPTAALEIGAAVCRALHAAFNAVGGDGTRLQVIHRDIKPSNVRLTADGDVKVLDFGVARVNMEAREAQTRTEAWIGTERYMAPERILMEGDSHEGDVYAMAATVVELLMSWPLGRTPVLEDRHAKFLETNLQKCRETLSSHDPGLVDELITLLGAALHATPSQRPTAIELAVSMTDLARRWPGDSLAVFSHQWVDRIAAESGQGGEKAAGVLMESNVPSQPTLGIPEASTTMGGGSSSNSPVNSLMIGLVVGLFIAMFMVGGVGTGLWLTNRPGTAPATLIPAPASLVPAVEPTLDPPAAPTAEEPGTDEPDAATTVAEDPAPAAPEPAATTPKPRALSTRAAAPAPAPATEAAPLPAGPSVSRALVAVQDASTVTVQCGDKRASGTASVRIVDFPAGPCSVSASYLGRNLHETVTITSPREVICVPSQAGLTCN